TASNSNRSSPACSPVLRKRCRSPILQNIETDTMVEKGSEQSDTSKSPSTPEQLVTRTFSGQSTRSGGKNSKKSRLVTTIWKSERSVIVDLIDPLAVVRDMDSSLSSQDDWEALMELEEALAGWLIQGSDWDQNWHWGPRDDPYQDEEIPARDILLQGRLYLSENWICFYSNIFRWETLLTVRLKDICSMTKEKTARLIPNAVQVCTDTEKHFFTSFGARDRTYMMMFRLWQNALLDKPLCPKELWHFVHQCYGNELGLTSDDEDYVPPDDDFNTMGYCEEIPAEENEVSNDNSSKSSSENKPDNSSPPSHKRSITHSTITSTTPPSSTDTPLSFDIAAEEYTDCLPDGDLLPLPLLAEERNSEPASPLDPVPPLALDFNDNEDIPTDLSDSSETDDEDVVGEDVQADSEISSVLFFLCASQVSEKCYASSGCRSHHFTGLPYAMTYFYTPKPLLLTGRVAKNKLSVEYDENRTAVSKVPRPNRERQNSFPPLKKKVVLSELELAKMEDALLESHRLSPKAKALKNSTLRRRKRPPTHLRTAHLDETLSPVTTPTDEEVIHRIKHVAGSTQTRHFPEHTPGGRIFCNLSKPLLIISFVICISLVLLVFLNVMLFYKLWMLEYSAQSLSSWQGLRLHESSKLPSTQMEWAQLLESQQRYHDAELQKWKEIIKSSVLLLDQMKDSLLSLQKGVGLRDYNSDSDEKRSRYH
ncbi:hypothetical protein cypCar_00034591, partial [Cyprinus carpio]